VHGLLTGGALLCACAIVSIYVYVMEDCETKLVRSRLSQWRSPYTERLGGRPIFGHRSLLTVTCARRVKYTTPRLQEEQGLVPGGTNSVSLTQQFLVGLPQVIAGVQAVYALAQVDAGGLPGYVPQASFRPTRSLTLRLI
jgi:hypothetical protein